MILNVEEVFFFCLTFRRLLVQPKKFNVSPWTFKIIILILVYYQTLFFSFFADQKSRKWNMNKNCQDFCNRKDFLFTHFSIAGDCLKKNATYYSNYKRKSRNINRYDSWSKQQKNSTNKSCFYISLDPHH